MSLSNSQQIFVQDIARLILRANSLGVNLTFGEAYRTADQEYLYFQGLTFNSSKRLVSAPRKSWTMKSNHLRRLAVDFNFFINGSLTYDNKNPLLIELGKYWEELSPDNRWGGFWKTPDTPHFEKNVKS